MTARNRKQDFEVVSDNLTFAPHDLRSQKDNSMISQVSFRVLNSSKQNFESQRFNKVDIPVSHNGMVAAVAAPIKHKTGLNLEVKHLNSKCGKFETKVDKQYYFQTEENYFDQQMSVEQTSPKLTEVDPNIDKQLD